jgi:hypothetical protein
MADEFVLRELRPIPTGLPTFSPRVGFFSARKRRPVISQNVDCVADSSRQLEIQDRKSDFDCSVEAARMLAGMRNARELIESGADCHLNEKKSPLLPSDGINQRSSFDLTS